MVTSSAAPWWGDPPTGTQGDYILHVTSTNKIWVPVIETSLASGPPPGLWAIVDPNDPSVVESWSTDPFVGSDQYRPCYDATEDIVWMPTWGSGYGSGRENFRLLGWDGTSGECTVDVQMPDDCEKIFINSVTGDLCALVTDNSTGHVLNRWFYTLNKSTGAIDVEVFDVGAGNDIWTHFPEFDSDGNLWTSSVVLSDYYTISEHRIDRAPPDGSSPTNVWSASGTLNGVYALAYDSVRDAMLAFRPNVDVDGSRGSAFIVDVETETAGDDIAMPLSGCGYTLYRWSWYPVYDGIRDVYWLVFSLDDTVVMNGETVYNAMVALNGSDLAVKYVVPNVYYGSEEDISIYVDDPGNDVCETGPVYTNPVKSHSGKVFWGAWFYGYDDATSRERGFNFLQWWEPDASRRWATININMRRR